MSMKIVRLQSRNIKRLRAVEITPDPKGNMVVIGGKNAAGKTSVLDSIMYAMGGGRTICDEPIRHGQRKAKVVCELDGLTVTRKFTRNGSELHVAGANGETLSSPQAVLDRLCGTLTFDPLAFLQQKPAEQTETARNLVGLDFTKLDAGYAEAYAMRRDVNRDMKGQDAVLAKMPKHDNAGDEEVSIADLSRQLQDAIEMNNGRDALRAVHVGLAETIEKAKAEVDHAQQQVTKWAAELKERDAQLAKLQAHYDGAHADIEALADVDTDPIQQQIANAETVNQKVRDNVARAKAGGRLKDLAGEAVKLTGTIEAIEEEKRAQLDAAKFPIEGLSFDDDGLTYNDVPFSQSSSAEQLRVSAAMGFALNPGLKVLLIRDGSLLDDNSLRLLGELAAEHDGQVWLERVGEGDECSLVIEDGHVKGDEGEQATEGGE